MTRKTILLAALSLLLIFPASASASSKAPKDEKVKNVILLIGDGLGLGAVGTWMLDNNYEPTAFDRAQYVGISKTYSKNNRVTDSAAAGSAMGSGQKTNNGMVNMQPDGTETKNLGEYSKEKGLSLGIVVTSYILDGTPAGKYAQANSKRDYGDINECIMTVRRDVHLGGGKKYVVEEKDTVKNMIEAAKAEGFTVVETQEDFFSCTDTPLLGILEEGSMPMAGETNGLFLTDAMTHTLDILDDNKKGFFAMIEGSKIDHAAHANNTEDLIFEMQEFDNAVNAAFDYADSHKGTLVIVTADHETGGVTMVSKNKDFTAGESGLDIKYSTTSHSGTPVIVYSYGASAYKFSGVMENTEIFDRIKEVLIDRK